ncbi:hypothetical protein KIN20_034975 [Parelaphostrongylus tenuis]|uniref:DUF155 domain-containing protein n=1 Tax=Parelaphostrongylus tenuis TaxID=148309 RepID=A0AAD5WJD2_PARTN|nr:hypothetical protein KIN20_034975 [Parelaphostrongylus tenuis]
MIRRSCSLLIQRSCRLVASSHMFTSAKAFPIRNAAVLRRQLRQSIWPKSSEKFPIREAEECEPTSSNSRRQSRKRRPLTMNSEVKNTRDPEVVALALCESLDLVGISADASLRNMYKVSYIDEDFDDTIHLVKKLEYSINPLLIYEIFIFQDGVAVFWNVDHVQRAQIIRDLERYMEGPYDSTITMEEQDRMPYFVSENDETAIKHDRFVLNANIHGADHRNFEGILERFSFSQAFAASVKVGVWETLLNNLAEPLSPSNKAFIPWGRKAALIKAGEFADLRHSINLDCTLLNRDFYWDRSQLEEYYLMSARHFSLGRRISGLNRRLDYCEELVKMVDNTIALRHASTLEWMIIVLIVIEVIFDVLHYVDSSPSKVVIVGSHGDQAGVSTESA